MHNESVGQGGGLFGWWVFPFLSIVFRKEGNEEKQVCHVLFSYWGFGARVGGCDEQRRLRGLL